MDVAELVVRVRADISGLEAGLATAQSQMQGFAARGAAAMGTAGRQAGQQLAAGLSEAGAAAQQVGATMATAGAGIVGALGLAVKAGSDYQNKLLDVKNNTMQTAAEFKQMDQTIRELARNSPVAMEQLAQGYMRVKNFGFGAADATKILDAAMKSAVATGAQTDATANALAGAMKNFGFHGADAVRVMNELHYASALGNTTLEQFTAHSGRAHAAAAALHLSLQDVDSALAALTRHQFNPANAETGVMGLMSKIGTPSNKSRALLDALQSYSSIPISDDFTPGGLGRVGIQGELEAIRAAAAFLRAHPAHFFPGSKKAPPQFLPGAPLGQLDRDMGQPQLLSQMLVNAQRGGLALGTLAGDSGFKDKTDIMGTLSKAIGGQMDATLSGFNDRMKTLSAQIGKLVNQLKLIGTEIASSVMPHVQKLVDGIQHLVQRFDALPEPVKKSIIHFAEIAGPMLLVGGFMASAAGKVLLLASAFIRIGAVLGPLVGEGGALAGVAAVLTGPVGIAIALITVAVGAFALAWAKDWGHIREVTAQAVGFLRPYLAQAWEAIHSTALAVWGPLKAFFLAIWPPIQQVAKVAWDAIVATIRVGSFLAKEIFEGAWTHVAAFFRGIWDVIAGVVKVAFGNIRAIFEVGLKLLTGDWEGAWKSALSIRATILDGLKQIFEGIIGVIGGAIGTVATAIYNFGKMIVVGLWEGIKNAWGSLAAGFDGLIQDLIAGAKATLGIHSPSTVFAGIGAQIGAGLAQGIAGSRPEVVRQLKAIVDDGREFFGSSADDEYTKIFEQSKIRPAGTRPDTYLGLVTGEKAHGVAEEIYSAFGALTSVGGLLRPPDFEGTHERSNTDDGVLAGGNNALRNLQYLTRDFGVQSTASFDRAKAALQLLGGQASPPRPDQSSFRQDLLAQLVAERTRPAQSAQDPNRLLSVTNAPVDFFMKNPNWFRELGQLIAGTRQQGQAQLQAVQPSQQSGKNAADPLGTKDSEGLTFGERAKKILEQFGTELHQYVEEVLTKQTVALLKDWNDGLQQSLKFLNQTIAAIGKAAQDALAHISSAVSGARADGGPVSSGRAYIVGERGPELFVPGASGSIVPNGALAGAGDGGGHTTIHFTVISPDAASFRQSRGQIFQDLHRSAEYFRQRNG